MARPTLVPARARGLVVLAAVALAGATGSARAADAAHPVVIELFQSQGCSSCPPANANLLRLVDRPDVLALSFQVTYWDHLGWKDIFGAPEFNDRQWAYAHALGHRQVWTPQVVVNGAGDTVGTAPGEIEALAARLDRGSDGPVVTVAADRATVGGGTTATGAEVWLVRFDPRVVEVPIAHGENAGRTLPHRNVVVELRSLGHWSGATQSFVLPPASRSGLGTAVLVQAGPGGPILAAGRG